jgi:glutamyl-tRNA synthetase/glutamyl-Q tRNA(Asp) synthetase
MTQTPWQNLSALLANRPPLTRFAPSPTGHLHLGHIASALYVWSIAKAVQGEVLLRIEDHDRGRCHKIFEEGIFDDLYWLGFIHEDPKVRESADSSPSHPHIMRQSEREDRYREVLNDLWNRSLVYACDCSRKAIFERSDWKNSTELIYDGHCRHRQLKPEPNRGLRLKIDSKPIRFFDAKQGWQEQNPAEQCGDFLIRERNGYWTYNFAVTVDDSDQGINLIVRGEDLLHATARQLYLRELLKNPNPVVFFHHPLIKDSTGEKKLSKIDQAESLKTMRWNGKSPQTLIGEVMFLLGLNASADRPLTLDEACHNLIIPSP